MKDVKSSAGYRGPEGHRFRRVLSAVFAGILFLGVFAPEKVLGDGGKNPDAKVVWMVRNT